MHVSSEPPDFSLEELVINIQEKEQLPSRTLTCIWQKKKEKARVCCKYVSRLQKIKNFKENIDLCGWTCLLPNKTPTTKKIMSEQIRKSSEFEIPI